MTNTLSGILLALCCVVLEGFGQVFLKKSVMTRARWFFWISAGIVMMTFEALLYTQTLKFLDVNVAFMICSLSLVAVTILSQLFLKEEVGLTRWIGVVFVTIGAGFVVLQSLI